MMTSVAFFAGLLIVTTIPAPSPSGSPQDGMHNLVVYGAGWSFFTREPDGWTGYTERSGEIGANVYFLHTGETFEQNGSLIRVTIETKIDNAIERDLAADMARFKKADPEIQFVDFQATYPGGSVFAKIYRRSKGDEYVAYVDTSPSAKFYFIVSYDPPLHGSATDSDLNAFRAVIKSLGCCMTVIQDSTPPPH
jgi:hypothetical protein